MCLVSLVEVESYNNGLNSFVHHRLEFCFWSPATNRTWFEIWCLTSMIPDPLNIYLKSVETHQKEPKDVVYSRNRMGFVCASGGAADL